MFYPFSFNVKYSLWACWLKLFSIGEKTVKWKCVIETRPETHTSMDRAALFSPGAVGQLHC